VKLLLDTHVALWALSEPERLPPPIQALILDLGNAVHVSAASVLEIAIKFRLGKTSAPPFGGRDALRFFGAAGFELLDVTAEHAAAVGELPAIHEDPFDRLLIAQALSEPMRLLTHDRKLLAYSDTIIGW
jgi:PIN domain nuclease of toxin-antitoxin system